MQGWLIRRVVAFLVHGYITNAWLSEAGKKDGGQSVKVQAKSKTPCNLMPLLTYY